MFATPDINRRRRFIINAAYAAIIIGIVFLVFRYLLNLLWPFLIAFLFAWILLPTIRWLTAKCHLKYNLSVALCLIVFFAILGGLIIAVSARLVTWISAFIVWLPTLYSDYIKPGLDNLSDTVEDLANYIGPSAYALVSDTIPNIMSSIGSAVTNLSVKLVSIASTWASKLPSRLLSTVICVISTVFITADFPRIIAFVMRQIPEKPRHIIKESKDSFVVVIKKYGKSYGIIMCITFAEIAVGLLLLQQKNAIGIAFLIALFDIFPIVGSGLILSPWGLIEILNGSVGKGIGILALWIIVIVVRQILEPRVVGHQVGLPPIVTLIAMFVGTKLFGGVGLLALPIGCAIFKSLDDTGVIHVLKREEPAKPPVPAPPASDSPGNKNTP